MKKLLLTIVLLILVGAIVFAASQVANKSSINRIQEDSPCPVTGCVSGDCHTAELLPETNDDYVMSCPKVSCSDINCHAWDRLTSHYQQANPFSLLIWIVLPVAVTCCLLLIMGKNGR